MKETLIITSIEGEYAQAVNNVGLSEGIANSLMLDRGMQHIFPRTRVLIANSIASSLSVLERLLDTGRNIPQVVPLYEWGNGEQEEESINVLGKCDTDKWAIEISPFFLQNVANSLEDRQPIYDYNVSLTELVGHESYHLWQSVKFPNTFKRHGEIDLEQTKKILRAGESLEKFYKPTRTERVAEMFGKIFSNAMAWERVSGLRPDEEINKYVENLDHILLD